jgi:hypothetical protein
LVLLLLLLLLDLFRKLLDLPTLLSVVVLGVMHWALLAALVVTGWLTWVLVVAWAMTPTSRCSCSGGSTGQQVVLATILLLLLLFAAALGSSICVRLASLPCFWSGL